MNVIKVYLSESGSIADLKKDFPLYQGAFHNKLLNVYVPVNMLPQSDASLYTAVKIGMIYTKRSGKLTQSQSYYMRYLKKLIYKGVEYALYERLMPQEFTVYAGEGANAPTLIVNAVNVKDNPATEGEPVVYSIITSQTVSLEVLPSAHLDNDPQVEPTELDLVNGAINSLGGRLDFLSDRGLWRADLPFINAYAPSPEQVLQNFFQQGYGVQDIGTYVTDLSGNMWIIADRGFNVDPRYPLVKIGGSSSAVIDGGFPDSVYLDEANNL